MDRRRLAFGLLGDTLGTEDILNTPIRRGGILPVTEYPDRTEFDISSGLTGALMDAFTAPARAARGEISEDQQIPEAFNFAGSLTLGSLLAPRPTQSVGMGGRAANAKTGAAVPLATRALEAQQPQGIRAFHGSPHDFDRFDMSKIGTGEGAQAYGHGLYFADAEDVAKGYRDRLKKDSKLNSATDRYQHLEIDGKPLGQQYDIDPSYVDELKPLVAAKDQNAVKSLLQEKRKRWQDISSDNTYPFPDYAADKLRAYDALISRLDDGGEIKDLGAGHMYEVRINADPNDFLDWYAPTTGATMERVAPLGVQEGAKGFDALQQIAAQLAKDGKLHPGKDLSVQVSEALRDAGVPGVRYLDQMSRGEGKGSSNYVVFDDALIEILRKYGLLGPVAGLGAAGLLADDGGQVY